MTTESAGTTDARAGRYLSLDAIRGIAVMGILLLNILSFSMPGAAYTNPLAWGGTGPLDIAAWAAGFVLFEGKMRGLFSLLFGASMTLVIERADARGGDGGAVHLRRMFWLFLFGLAHHLLVWEGDILVQYALAGAVAFLFVRRSPRTLGRAAAVLLALSVVGHAAMMGGAYALEAHVARPDAKPAERRQYRTMLSSFAQPGSASVRGDLARYRSDYPHILADRAANTARSIALSLTMFGFESLGLMVLGILLLRTGFLTGEWEAGRYRRWVVRCYLIGIPPAAALALWNIAGGFDTLDVFATQIAWVEPFRYPVMLGHAALAMLLIKRFAASAAVARVAAAGRMAFTNYLLTSLVMTILFYGYGGALYGWVGRTEAYLFVFAMWAAMLAWSSPWLGRYRYGPFEWAWRSLSRGERQPMRPD